MFRVGDSEERSTAFEFGACEDQRGADLDSGFLTSDTGGVVKDCRRITRACCERTSLRGRRGTLLVNRIPSRADHTGERQQRRRDSYPKPFHHDCFPLIPECTGDDEVISAGDRFSVRLDTHQNNRRPTPRRPVYRLPFLRVYDVNDTATMNAAPTLRAAAYLY